MTTPFPDLPAAEKAKVFCEALGIEKEFMYNRFNDAQTVEYPPLTLDFLFGVAKEKGHRIRLEMDELGTCICDVGFTSAIHSAAANPTDALAMALIRFAGGVV